MHSILITGGTGFFGRSLLRYLKANLILTQETSFSVLSRNPDVFLEKYPEFSDLSWLTFYQGDVLGNLASINKKEFTHIIHAAADSTDGPQMNFIDRYDQIINGTKNVLDYAVSSGVRRILFTSSGGAYGPPLGGMQFIPESYQGIPDPLSPSNVYGLSKRMAEHLCALYAYQYSLEVVIARCFAFVGPDLPLDAHFAIGNFIRDAIEKDRIEVNGDGTPLRSYLYQDDLAEWLMVLLENGRNCEAYNVGSDQSISILELAYLIRDLIAPEKAVLVKGKVIQDQKVRNRYLPNVDKVKNEFDLRVKISLEDAIKKTADGYISRNLNQ